MSKIVRSILLSLCVVLGCSSEDKGEVVCAQYEHDGVRHECGYQPEAEEPEIEQELPQCPPCGELLQIHETDEPFYACEHNDNWHLFLEVLACACSGGCATLCGAPSHYCGGQYNSLECEMCMHNMVGSECTVLVNMCQ